MSLGFICESSFTVLAGRKEKKVKQQRREHKATEATKTHTYIKNDKT